MNELAGLIDAEAIIDFIILLQLLDWSFLWWVWLGEMLRLYYFILPWAFAMLLIKLNYNISIQMPSVTGIASLEARLICVISNTIIGLVPLV